MARLPTISVVMPVYNSARYLREAVESILSQTFGDFEFLIFDDGSTDGSVALLREYARRDPRIRLIESAHAGYVAHLIAGCAQARGEFIARMDSDDVSLPERFQLQVEHLRAHADCVLVGSRVMLIDPDGRPIRQWASATTHEEIDQAHLARGWPMVHPSVMIRRLAFEQVGGYQKKYETLEDVDLFLRLAEVGRICNLPQVLLKYRQHMQSVCHTENDRQARIRDGLMNEAAARRGIQLPPAPLAPPKKSPAEVHRLWAWWALNEGHVPTARRHAMKVMQRAPWSVDSWRLMCCALRGR
jgi:glycosyltransferase involved in cell wall biosynthesis